MSMKNARNRPAIPGERCPAERNNSWNDPKVKITSVDRWRRYGTRTCGRCGCPDVPVEQNYGERISAWRYTSHLVPIQAKGGQS